MRRRRTAPNSSSSLVYVLPFHLDHTVVKTLISQPGHGAPALLATLFLEGSITRFYPEYSMSADGIEAFIRAFSMPGGFPSHVNAEVSLLNQPAT